MARRAVDAAVLGGGGGVAAAALAARRRGRRPSEMTGVIVARLQLQPRPA